METEQEHQLAADPGLSWAFLAIGAATQGGALLLLRPTLRLLRAGGDAEGAVVDNEASVVQSRGPARTFYFPKVEFTTKRGERISFTSRTGGLTARPKGSPVRVLYDPQRPQGAELASFRTLWLFPVVTSVFGLPFLAAGLFGLF